MTELPDWVRQLDMAPHPEGGYFRETWRSDLTIGESVLPPDYNGPRSAELWFHHRGSPLLLEIGRERDNATTHVLGPDITAGEHPQLLVPPGYWQRARPRDAEAALVSCVVVPGFDFADFALGSPTD